MAPSRFKILVVWFFAAVCIGFSQEKGQSAELTEELNSDAFQEFFFEALKQKSIENYDRAIQALLECKKLQPNNEVVDYELGLNYMEQTNYIQAQEYFERAIDTDPSNKWYQDALLSCLLTQHNYSAAVPVAEKLLAMDVDYYKSLARIYIQLGEEQQAKKVLDKMQVEGIDLTAVTQLKNELLMRGRTQAIVEVEQTHENPEEALNSPVDQYKKQIEKQFKKTDFAEALHFSSEAIDNFPTQPLFYLFKAQALNKLQNYKMAIQILEQGLSYILDDQEMENNFYKEFVVAYTAVGDKKKTDHYRGMIKN